MPGSWGWGGGSRRGPRGVLRLLLASLQPDRREQGQALALLRRQAELEVWETQKALGELLSRPRLEVSWPALPLRPGPAWGRLVGSVGQVSPGKGAVGPAQAEGLRVQLPAEAGGQALV